MALMAALILGLEIGRTQGERTSTTQQLENDSLRCTLGELCARDSVSPMFRAVAKAVKPAVVEIRVMKVASPGLVDLLKQFSKSDGKASPPSREGLRPRAIMGLGSGVIVDAEHGYILTDDHVVRGASSVEVVLADGRRFRSEWVRSDQLTDLAVVKIQPDHLIAAPIGDSENVQPGDWVLAIGAPNGLAQTVTAGIISATGRATDDPSLKGNYQDFLQTDAAINRGNSGGPLVNMHGEVIGLNNMIISTSGGNEGIGLSIPSSMFKVIMNKLITVGRIERGWLGVAFQDVDYPLARSFQLNGIRGALVTKVESGSPASKAGLAPGDFVVAIDGKSIINSNSLRNLIGTVAPGGKVKIDIIRDGKEQQLEATLADPSDAVIAAALSQPDDPEAAEPATKVFARYGLEVAELNEQLATKYGYRKGAAGVVVVSVRPMSSASEQGVTEGMQIVKVQSRSIENVEQLTEELSNKSSPEGVRILVSTAKGKQQFVFVNPLK